MNGEGKMGSIEPHLTEDELDEVLMANGAADTALPEDRLAHLAECHVCRARCIEFSATLAQFNQASLAWSEARSNTMTRDLTEAAARRRGWEVPNALLATVSAVLLAAAGLMMTGSAPLHQLAGTGSGAASQTHTYAAAGKSTFIASDAEPQMRGADAGHIASGNTGNGNTANDNIVNDNIVNDNAMLNAIDSALSTPEPSPVELYRTSAGDAAVHRAAGSQGVNE